MKNDNFIVITGYMINELKLKGNELLIYAIIHGFSQCENQKYTAGIKYLMECTCASKQTVISTLQSLYDKGFIEKEEEIINNVKFVYYWSNFLTTRQEILPNNIRDSVSVLENNLYSSSLDTENKEKKNIKRKEKRFVPPTVEEVREYCKERNNNIEAEEFVDFYTMKGWKVGKETMKDWKAAIRNWENRRKKENAKISNPTAIKRQRLTYEATEEDIEEYDRRFKI